MANNILNLILISATQTLVWVTNPSQTGVWDGEQNPSSKIFLNDGFLTNSSILN